MTQPIITDLAAAAKRSELLEGRLIDREQHVATLQNELEAAQDTIAALHDRLDTVTDTDAGASAAMIAVPGCARARSEPREEHG